MDWLKEVDDERERKRREEQARKQAPIDARRAWLAKYEGEAHRLQPMALRLLNDLGIHWYGKHWFPLIKEFVVWEAEVGSWKVTSKLALKTGRDIDKTDYLEVEFKTDKAPPYFLISKNDYCFSDDLNTRTEIAATPDTSEEELKKALRVAAPHRPSWSYSKVNY